MTVATLAPRQPASLLRPPVHRKSPTILKRPRFHAAAKKTTTTNSIDTKPVLLRNLRNYYARRRPSMSISNKAPEESSADRKVQFFPRVRVKRIPNRLSYSDEDRLSLWVPKKELKRMVLKNHAEYAYEGQDWQSAPEEADFRQRNGELVHPFYLWAEQEDKAAATSGEESDASSEADGPDDDSSMDEC